MLVYNILTLVKAFVKSDNGVYPLIRTIWHLIIANVALAFLTALTLCLECFKSFDTIIPKSVSSLTDCKMSPFKL